MMPIEGLPGTSASSDQPVYFRGYREGWRAAIFMAKGRVIADLPGHYLNWFARVGFPPGDIGRLLALMQEIDHNGLKPLLEPLRRG